MLKYGSLKRYHKDIFRGKIKTHSLICSQCCLLGPTNQVGATPAVLGQPGLSMGLGPTRQFLGGDEVLYKGSN